MYDSDSCGNCLATATVYGIALSNSCNTVACSAITAQHWLYMSQNVECWTHCNILVHTAIPILRVQTVHWEPYSLFRYNLRYEVKTILWLISILPSLFENLRGKTNLPVRFEVFKEITVKNASFWDDDMWLVLLHAQIWHSSQTFITIYVLPIL
jgi:hypothetical protein